MSDFIAEAARSGLLGPTFLTTRLRLKLGQSPALGGGCVVNTGAVRTWLELSQSPETAHAELVASTTRAADNWAGLGVRVNSVARSPVRSCPASSPPPGRVRRQPGRGRHARAGPPFSH